MTMTNEDRKIYNEKYYAENKKRIAILLATKSECPLCSKLISKSNLERHKIGNSCQKNRSIKTTVISEMKEQLEKLSNEIEKIKSNLIV
jgi:hypothetical protein